MDTFSNNPHARVFQFEKIFSGKERYQALNELVTFAVSLPDINLERIGSIEGWLERKIHQSSEGFPVWENWTDNQKRQFERICGLMMEKLGYKIS